MSNRDNIEITLITENDRERMEQVAQMETDVFPDPWSYHEVRSTVRQKHTFCAAAMEGDTLLGYFLCYYVLDECEIARIAVAESERRRGIGQMLFGFMEQICQEKQLKRMLLDVRKSNQTAIAFYEKNKFGIDGERKFYYGGKNPESGIWRTGVRMLDVCLLGSGGMMPLPYRWLTALMTRYNGSQLLIDCGEGTQIALKEKGWSFKPIDVICFTHYHGDHISGLPGLLLTMGNADRKEPLTLIGPKGLERVVSSLRVIAPELPFEIHYREITEPEQIFEMDGYRLKAFRVKHNVICYGYTIEIDRAGKFDVQRATEQKIPKEYWKHLQKGETVELDGRILTPEMVLGPPRRGIKLT